MPEQAQVPPGVHIGQNTCDLPIATSERGVSGCGDAAHPTSEKLARATCGRAELAGVTAFGSYSSKRFQRVGAGILSIFLYVNLRAGFPGF